MCLRADGYVISRRREEGDCVLMLPIGFTGKVTVIPIEDESRAEMLWFSIPQDDEIVPRFVLNFDLGRLKSVSNESYLLAADVDEEERGQRVREGRIFGEVQRRSMSLPTKTSPDGNEIAPDVTAEHAIRSEDRFKTRGLYNNSASRDRESDKRPERARCIHIFWGIAASATVTRPHGSDTKETNTPKKP